jgi:hypothetical protein
MPTAHPVAPVAHATLERVGLELGILCLHASVAHDVLPSTLFIIENAASTIGRARDRLAASPPIPDTIAATLRNVVRDLRGAVNDSEPHVSESLIAWANEIEGVLPEIWRS